MACQIYRCYTVWGSWWKVVSIPIVMLTGTTGKQAYLTLQASLISMPVCGYVAVAKLSRWPVSRTQNDGTWVALAFFCLSLATNLLVTLLIGQNSASSELLVWLTTVVLKLPASIGWAVSFVGRVAIRNIIIQRQLCKSNRRLTTHVSLHGPFLQLGVWPYLLSHAFPLGHIPLPRGSFCGKSSCSIGVSI